LPDLGQRAQDHRRQAGGPVLQDVIGGPLLDELDRCLVAEHTGPDDERYVRVELLSDLERLLAGEAGQVVIGQDYVGPELGHLLDKRRLVFDDDGDEVKARVDQEPLGQRGIPGFILQDQDAGTGSR
jgi:hypothetical protein